MLSLTGFRILDIVFEEIFTNLIIHRQWSKEKLRDKISTIKTKQSQTVKGKWNEGNVYKVKLEDIKKRGRP